MQGKVSMAKAEPAVYVGIDVSKAWLDIYLHPSGHAFRVSNSRDGLRKLRGELAGKTVSLVVLEATGKLHHPAHRMLGEAGLPVAVVNPYRSRKLADALWRVGENRQRRCAHASALWRVDRSAAKRRSR
jgi:transposase